MRGDKYRLNLKPEELESDDIPVDFNEPPATGASITLEDDEADEPFAIRETKRPAAPAAKPQAPPPPPAQAPTVNTRVTQVKTVSGESEDLEVEQFVSEVSTSVDLTKVGEPKSPPLIPQLNEKQLEAIIRKQSAEVIESVVWKVVPELATQIIERELNRLLKEREASPY
jgi:hypothetical protein